MEKMHINGKLGPFYATRVYGLMPERSAQDMIDTKGILYHGLDGKEFSTERIDNNIQEELENRRDFFVSHDVNGCNIFVGFYGRVNWFEVPCVAFPSENYLKDDGASQYRECSIDSISFNYAKNIASIERIIRDTDFIFMDEENLGEEHLNDYKRRLGYVAYNHIRSIR